MTLNDAQRSGLDFRWYFHYCDYDDINKVLHIAYLTHFLERVRKALRDNEGSDRPSNWTRLGQVLGRNAGHMQRSKGDFQKASNPDGDLVFGGKRRPHRKAVLPGTLVRYSIAIALGVPESELSLSKEDLITAATEHLVRRHRPDETISKLEARGYGFYVLACPRRPHSTELDEKTVRRLVKDPGDWPEADDLRQAVLKVAQLVGEILRDDFDAMLKQSR